MGEEDFYKELSKLFSISFLALLLQDVLNGFGSCHVFNE